MSYDQPGIPERPNPDDKPTQEEEQLTDWVEQAQARLNQVRLKVTQEVASVFHERAKLREIVRARLTAIEESMAVAGKIGIRK